MQKFALTDLTAEQVQIIGAALHALPYRTVAALIDQIDKQLVEQQSAKVAGVDAAPLEAA